MNEPRPGPAQGPASPQPNVLPRPAGAPATRPAGAPGPQPVRPLSAAPQVHRAPPPLPASKPDDGLIDLASLEDEDAPPAPRPSVAQPSAASAIQPPSKIKLTGGGDKHNYTHFKRNTRVDGSGACRVRTFHGRLNDEGLAFMDDKINEWIDNHPEVEVKQVNTVIGHMEGKHNEQALFITIWY